MYSAFIVLEGNPISKKPARIFQAGGKSIHYDPNGKDSKRIKKEIIKQLHENHWEFLDILFHSNKIYSVTFNIYLPIPVIKDVEKTNLIIWNLKQPTIKPDNSNVVKFYEDCGNGLLWQDDCMIVSHYIRKFYSKRPRIEIFVNARNGVTMSEKTKKVLSIFSPNDITDLIERFDELSALEIEPREDMEGFHECGSEELHNEIASILLRLSLKYGSQFAKLKKFAETNAQGEKTDV